MTGGGGGGGGAIPAPPGFKENSKAYRQFIRLQRKMLRRQTKGELAERRFIDPKYIEHQQGLQDKYGTKQYEQQRSAFQTLDPTGAAARESGLSAMNDYALNDTPFEKRAHADLASGYAMPDDFKTELENMMRGTQAATGQTEGNAAMSAETIFKGKNALDLYQQRMQNSLQASQLKGNKLGQQSGYLAGTPGPLQASTMIQPVTSDRPFAFVDPNAGWKGIENQANNYANQVGAYGAQNAGGGSGGMGAIGSILQAVGPILASVAFSDRRLKTDIHPVGRTPGGRGLYAYKYKSPNYHIGVMADENPDIAIRHPSGFDMVDYSRVN